MPNNHCDALYIYISVHLWDTDHGQYNIFYLFLQVMLLEISDTRVRRLYTNNQMTRVYKIWYLWSHKLGVYVKPKKLIWNWKSKITEPRWKPRVWVYGFVKIELLVQLRFCVYLKLKNWTEFMDVLFFTFK